MVEPIVTARLRGLGIWMLRDARGTFVGRCGIHRWSLDDEDRSAKPSQGSDPRA